MNKCPVCNLGDNIALYVLYDDRYSYPGFFQLCKCYQCGHKFLKVDFSPEQLRRLYKVFALLHIVKINHIITRFCDALGIGDNYLFFLRKNA